MLVFDLLDNFYTPIRLKNNVLFVCSIDVDAICSTKILLNLCKMDNITYSLKCVTNTKDFHMTITENKTIYNHIVCINCGGNINLTKYYEAGIECQIFVLDSYRPWHLKNIYNKEFVNIVIDKEDDLSNIPDEDHIQEYLSESYDDNSSDHTNTDVVGPRNKSNVHYMDGTKYTIPCCKLLFDLVVILRKDNLDLLWCTICGITYNYFSDKLSRESYISMVTYLQQHLLRISMNDTFDKASCDTYKMNISYRNELNLFLYRHWSLMDSMCKSLSTSCSFKVWTVKGRKRLMEYLAHVGLPLKQCKQKYQLMSLHYKNTLDDILQKNCERFRIKNLIIPSFVINYGYQLEVSALDLVFCVMTCLDFHTEDDINSGEQFLSALQILERSSIDVIENIIENAKYAIDQICTHIQSFIDLHYVISAGPFHLGVIPEGFQTHIIKSVGPILEFCAKYLLNAHVSLTKNKKALSMPLILCLQSTELYTSTIIGVPAVIEDCSINDYIGDYFKKTLNHLGIKICTPFFKTNIIQIPTAERAKFLDTLIEIME